MGPADALLPGVSRSSSRWRVPAARAAAVLAVALPLLALAGPAENWPQVAGRAPERGQVPGGHTVHGRRDQTDVATVAHEAVAGSGVVGAGWEAQPFAVLIGAEDCGVVLPVWPVAKLADLATDASAGSVRHAREVTE